MGQRETASSTISAAHCAWLVEKYALGSSLPAGSRVSTQRMGSGSMPVEYQRAVPVVTSSLRSVPPYHLTVNVSHPVFGSLNTMLKLGSRFPTTRGRPI